MIAISLIFCSLNKRIRVFALNYTTILWNHHSHLHFTHHRIKLSCWYCFPFPRRITFVTWNGFVMFSYGTFCSINSDFVTVLRSFPPNKTGFTECHCSFHCNFTSQVNNEINNMNIEHCSIGKSQTNFGLFSLFVRQFMPFLCISWI